MNQNFTKNILERFSRTLIGGGKKNTGHRFLLESLFLLRKTNQAKVTTSTTFSIKKKEEEKVTKPQNIKQNLNEKQSQKEKKPILLFKKTQNAVSAPEKQTNRKENHKVKLQQRAKAITQFLSLPSISDNEKKRCEDNRLKTGKRAKIESSTPSHFHESDTPIVSTDTIKMILKQPVKKQNSIGERHNWRRHCAFLLKKRQQQKTVAKSDQQHRFAVDNLFWGKENRLTKTICLRSIEKVKPILETRKKRKGRMTYQVPLVTFSQRQEGKAIALLKENAYLQKKNEKKRSTSPKVTPLVTPLANQRNDDVLISKKSSSEQIQNLNHFAIPLLYTAQTATNRSLSDNTLDTHGQIPQLAPVGNKRSEKNGFLFLPSLYSRVDERNHTIEIQSKERKNTLLQTNLPLSLASFHRSSLLSLPEKKHFLDFIQKPSVKYWLSEQLLLAGKGKGGSIEKKKQLHRIALQNRVYQHFRWW